MNRADVTERVRKEVQALLDFDIDFAHGDLLVENGLDSLLGVQLTLNIEDAFGLLFEDDEITRRNFESIDRIVDLLLAKLEG